jgi:hypothetical protein
VSGWWAAAFVVQWILVTVLAVVVVALARQIGVLQLRLAPLGALEVDDEGPPLDEAPEARRVRSPDGSSTVLGGPGRGRLVAFVSDTCPICEQVVSDPDLETAYRVPGVPFVVVLDEVGVVRSKGTVNSLEQVEGLVDTARRRSMHAEELRAG